MTTPNFDSDEHALVAGIIIGMMVKAGIKAEPVMDTAGNYKPMIRLFLDLGHVEGTPVMLTVEA